MFLKLSALGRRKAEKDANENIMRLSFGVCVNRLSDSMIAVQLFVKLKKNKIMKNQKDPVSCCDDDCCGGVLTGCC